MICDAVYKSEGEIALTFAISILLSFAVLNKLVIRKAVFVGNLCGIHTAYTSIKSPCPMSEPAK